MNRSLVFEILELGDSWQKNREFIEGLFNVFGYYTEENKPGNYDAGTDGYLVFKHPNDSEYVLVNLQEDSYSGGYYSSYRMVKPTKKTITVWE